MNSSREQQPNTAEWLQPPQLRHAANTPTPPCWVTNPDFPRALLREQVTGISGWQGEAIPPRVEQYSQLHKEKAKGLFRTLAIPKRLRGSHVFFPVLMSWPWTFTVPFPLEEHPWFAWLPSRVARLVEFVEDRRVSPYLWGQHGWEGRAYIYRSNVGRSSNNKTFFFVKEEDLLKPFITIVEVQQLDRCIRRM